MNHKNSIRKPIGKVVGVALFLSTMATAQIPAMEVSPAEVEARIGVLERRVAELERARSGRASVVDQSSIVRERSNGRILYGTVNRTEAFRLWPDYWARLQNNGH